LSINWNQDWYANNQLRLHWISLPLGQLDANLCILIGGKTQISIVTTSSHFSDYSSQVRRREIPVDIHCIALFTTNAMNATQQERTKNNEILNKNKIK